MLSSVPSRYVYTAEDLQGDMIDIYIYIYIGSIELKSAVFLHGHSAQVGTTHHGTRRVPLYRYPL